MDGAFPNETLPVCGGHKGAGIGEQVGPYTESFEVGDHVVLSALSGMRELSLLQHGPARTSAI
jgi:Zn-dependent alcohol dehydrogenase